MNHNLDASLPWLDALKWNADGLIPAIAQDAENSQVLMLAFMNREALQATLESGHATYWSRSRQKLWKKGEESGHIQEVREIRADCDGDTILLSVTQKGGIACHTGHASCFFFALEKDRWQETDPALKTMHEIYRYE